MIIIVIILKYKFHKEIFSVFYIRILTFAASKFQIHSPATIGVSTRYNDMRFSLFNRKGIGITISTKPIVLINDSRAFVLTVIRNCFCLRF